MDPVEILLVVLTVGAGFFVKGVTGMGGPMLAIPVMAGFVGIEQAVVVISVPSLVANTWLLWEHRGSAGDTKAYLPSMLTAGFFGTLAGAYLLRELDDVVLSWVLAGVVIAYIVRYLTNQEFRIGERLAKWLSAPVGLVGGALQGATGVSAPVLATYLHGLRLDPSVFIFSITVPFWIFGIVQYVGYWTLDMLTWDRIGQGAIATIPALMVVPLGMRISRRIKKKTFEYAVLGVLLASVIRLIWSAASG
ncbi:MAG: sulfite exporter TauE/SafE family protein [Acidimicrobiia bacterium]|nr:sulfite exporter TauE/SafE family protein [Acidimicrobiia bacterium]